MPSIFPYPDASFDLVSLANMIPFFPELARVTAPGGAVVFSFSGGADTPIYVPPEVLRTRAREAGFHGVCGFCGRRRHGARGAKAAERRKLYGKRTFAAR